MRFAKLARKTFIPLNIQQRPELFWSVIVCCGVSMLKCVSSSAAAFLFFARLSIAFAAIALASALSAAVSRCSFCILPSISADIPPPFVWAFACNATDIAKATMKVCFLIPKLLFCCYLGTKIHIFSLLAKSFHIFLSLLFHYLEKIWWYQHLLVTLHTFDNNLI